jgi:hypothetical protein
MQNSQKHRHKVTIGAATHIESFAQPDELLQCLVGEQDPHVIRHGA